MVSYSANFVRLGKLDTVGILRGAMKTHLYLNKLGIKKINRPIYFAQECGRRAARLGALGFSTDTDPAGEYKLCSFRRWFILDDPSH